MDLFSSFSDDQLALLGCAVAFVTCGFLMTVSYYVGNKARQEQNARKQILTTARRNAETVKKAA